MKFLKFSALAMLTLATALGETPCVIVDTGQVKCYNNSQEISYPRRSGSFYGQDAQYVMNPPAYTDNGDGTVTDLNTGLMWTKGVDPRKVSLVEAERIAKRIDVGGYRDWRVPNIKEMYSLIDFRGYTGFSGIREMYSVPSNFIPFIDTDYFDFRLGNTRTERYIDAQWLSSTKYVSTTMNGAKTLFGVNFADGRIKGYGYSGPGRHSDRRPEKKFFVRFVRGKPYGYNDFTDNKNGTITDRATGLMWMQNDSGKTMSWKQALKYAENLNYAGYRDWRLPNAKELQYIVDYTRSPDTTGSAAIDPIFRSTPVKNEAGQKDFAFYWTSTTHLDGPRTGSCAAYVSFGRAIGQMHGTTMDVHGAGAQRSDPKSGRPQLGRGPQGDAVRIYNMVRCVRGGNVKIRTREPRQNKNEYPYKIRIAGKTKSVSSSSSSQGERFVRRLDRNGDGKVSRSEFDGPKHHFSHLDKDGDGYLSTDEAPPPPRGRD
jgi:hypothetical protein